MSIALEDSLDDDVILTILSFAPYRIRGTNKHLTQLDLKRERIHMIQIYAPFEKEKKKYIELNPDDPDYIKTLGKLLQIAQKKQMTQTLHTIIVHPKRNKLHPIEKDYGFKTIANSIDDALNSCHLLEKHKTIRVLVHSGVYRVDTEDGDDFGFGPTMVSHRARFIGLGNVIIKRRGGIYEMDNITLHGGIKCFRGCVTAKNCTFGNYYPSVGIYAEDVRGDIIVDNCKFLPRNEIHEKYMSQSAITWVMKGGPYGKKLIVNGCDFGNAEQHCVEISVLYNEDNASQMNEVALDMEFTNNNFGHSEDCVAIILYQEIAWHYASKMNEFPLNFKFSNNSHSGNGMVLINNETGFCLDVLNNKVIQLCYQ